MIAEMTTGEMARIFMKDGNQKMGLLLNDVENPDAFDEGVKFVPHNQVGDWLVSYSDEFIQVLDSAQVDGIDIFMK